CAREALLRPFAYW
nr:immunoglobulin heavy chain junction region [Mus musculus]NSM03780.1 immunoglobulin heavy chain junction region [Mus musculus]NSM04144.1 immunoglobulin heavy chain junction region [Mus musculus]NSM04266.1 immunoglobulin heavy chain junction region [Mus musculus]NSM04473.1 immunoglobulin heavy chain junction region [Mus musculus]